MGSGAGRKTSEAAESKPSRKGRYVLKKQIHDVQTEIENAKKATALISMLRQNLRSMLQDKNSHSTHLNNHKWNEFATHHAEGIIKNLETIKIWTSSTCGHGSIGEAHYCKISANMEKSPDEAGCSTTATLPAIRYFSNINQRKDYNFSSPNLTGETTTHNGFHGSSLDAYSNFLPVPSSGEKRAQSLTDVSAIDCANQQAYEPVRRCSSATNEATAQSLYSLDDNRMFSNAKNNDTTGSNLVLPNAINIYQPSCSYPSYHAASGNHGVSSIGAVSPGYGSYSSISGSPAHSPGISSLLNNIQLDDTCNTPAMPLSSTLDFIQPDHNSPLRLYDYPAHNVRIEITEPDDHCTCITSL